MLRHNIKFEPSTKSMAERLVLAFCSASGGNRVAETFKANCNQVQDCNRCDIFKFRINNEAGNEEVVEELLSILLHDLKESSNKS